MILYLLDLLGVAVFAASGALAAGRKSLDLLGVMVIAAVTAIGGGTIRDLLLDRNPVFWIADPTYLIVIVAAASATVAWARFRRPPDSALAIADGLGLGFFAVSGARIAEAAGLPGIIVVLMGTITGVAGGVIRDVLTTEIPMIFRKGNIYATAAIGGCALYIVMLRGGAGDWAAAVTGMVFIVGLRFAAILWGLQLPVFTVGGEGGAGSPPAP